MNGKFEEKLARLAFGDMSAEEARELERKAASDPEAARALSQFRAMRAELKSLGESVPPDQLSRERLRDAILGQGLRTQEKRNESRGWMWMPVLAGAAAFALFTLRPGAGRTEDPKLVLGSDAALTAKLSEPTDQTFSVPVSTQKKSAPEVVKLIEDRPASRLAASTVANRVVKRNTPRTIVLNATDFSERRSEADKGKPVTTPTKREPVASLVAAKGDTNPPELEASAGPIILIDTHKDADTGASTATEVGTPSNVLVGG